MFSQKPALLISMVDPNRIVPNEYREAIDQLCQKNASGEIALDTALVRYEVGGIITGDELEGYGLFTIYRWRQAMICNAYFSPELNGTINFTQGAYRTDDLWTETNHQSFVRRAALKFSLHFGGFIAPHFDDDDLRSLLLLPPKTPFMDSGPNAFYVSTILDLLGEVEPS